MNKKHYDVVIIGGGLSGLCAAYTLTQYGIRCCIVEKSGQLGGGNQSFVDEAGNLFDMGYHALDNMRSPVTTRLFEHVLQGKLNKVNLDRGIVLDRHLIPYNSPLSDWPASLASKVDLASKDDISGELSLDAIGKVYGQGFAKYCEDEILASYPSERLAMELGKSISTALGMVYPWFFPALDRGAQRTEKEWEAYHDKMRNQQQSVLYPQAGGFNGFVDALAAAIDRRYCDVYLGCGDMNIEFEQAYQCRGVETTEHKLSGDHYFWCAPFFSLAGMFGMELPKGKPQTLALGSFAYGAEVLGDYHEILVGSKEYPVNRISFPGKLQRSANNLIQMEYLFPSDMEFDEQQAHERWTSCLSELGPSRGQDPLHFKFDKMPRGMVCSEPLEVITDRYHQAFQQTDTNFVLPFVNAGPENINRLVPGVIKNTTNYIVNHWGY